MRRWGWLFLLVFLPAAGSAQREGRNSTTIRNQPYDGQFTYARIKYEASSGGFGFGRGGFDQMWNHDYQNSDLHLPRILQALTSMNVRTDGSNVFTFDDPQLFKFPFAYLCEVGAWRPTPAEIVGMRNYLTRGGFLLVDDFGGSDIYNFQTQLAKVLPGARLVQLPESHPIFHSFYEIGDNALRQVAASSYRGDPVYLGVFEDNDPARRLLMVISYNGDVSEFWEYSGTGRYAVDPTNDAYKLGVNFVMYALTH